MKSKVFCIGELLIDFICKDSADLINGVNYEKKAGGAPANVAATISKLENEAYFLGQVGKDSFGEFLINILKEVEVNTDMVEVDGSTTLAFVSIDSKGERNFEFKRGCDRDYDFNKINLNKISTKDIIHFGSATAFLEGKLKETYFKLAKYAIKNNIFISFDPNYRDSLITDKNIDDYLSCVKKFIGYSSFIKLSEEELSLITSEEDMDKGIDKIHLLGAKVVAVTLGERGTLFSYKKRTIIPSIKIKQVDSTGAGDAFVGAVLSKLCDVDDNKNVWTRDWEDIIRFANKVGAKTCENYGAISSIPTLNDLENKCCD
ncbi:carbohydrate kinase [Clostridium sp.]|uniref:carbohydrate kinase family protein n=1 Tax=Clostridium TaxID=1485 RepID=UPI00115B409B|nr:carbohydrate kinase [Clostridium sp.]MDU1276833.1 carbohydrate kinase [Clostridium sp.]MDU2158483.1 carbohydrate kinase [Clostridium sp.]MDU7086522.1 carbohydrate kinase [Clostridium sp.]MDU7946796.1 carbohydrate kinase [Clostridium sp.]